MHPPVNAWVFEHGHRHLRSEKNPFRAVTNFEQKEAEAVQSRG